MEENECMHLFELEQLIRKDKNKFLNLVKKTYSNLGLEDTLRLIKKSGICINPYGTGEPKDKKLFNQVFEFLQSKEHDSKSLSDFLNEINILNAIYRRFDQKYMKKIEKLIDADIHVNSYLIALEINLSEFQYQSFFNLISGRINGLNHNSQDIYENIVQSSGLILKYFMYKKYKFGGISNRIDKQDVISASEHLTNSSIRVYMDNIMYLWDYFDVNISVLNKDKVYIKTVGDDALGKHISHLSFMDIRNAKMSRQGLEQAIFKPKYNITNNLPPEYISSKEELACEFIEEYFSTKDLNIEFNGILLSELIRAYSLVSIECEKFLKNRKNIGYGFNDVALNEVCIVKSKIKWINKLTEVGIRKSKADEILKLMTFNNSSNDLFDCPFIQMGNNLVVLPSASIMTDSSRAILLNLNSREINISKKGDEFERLIREVISKRGIRCINLQKKDYECDAVFALGNDLFFLETKHLNHPTSYREYMRHLDDIREASSQLNRIVEFYTTDVNLEEIKSKLDIETVDSISKLVVTNTSQGQKLKIGDTYITDDTCFVGYFERRPPQIVAFQKGSIVTRSLFSEYFMGNLNKEQFMNLLEKSPLIEQNKRRIGYAMYDFSEQIGVEFEDFSVKVNTVVYEDFLTDDERTELSNIYK